MLNSEDLLRRSVNSLDAIDGEPLAGSGFENEEPEPDFKFQTDSSEEVD